MPKRVVVGVSGGSGMLYAFDLLRTLRTLPVETHLVVTNGAKQVIPTELDETVLDLENLADVVYNDTDLGAAVSSGSFRTHG
ncbi:flavoprotein, partial [Escherichia coli]|uniref:flavoprotein n=1 Tax=Escherichia coli TaxID=562 RepID=UPI0024C4E353